MTENDSIGQSVISTVPKTRRTASRVGYSDLAPLRGGARRRRPGRPVGRLGAQDEVEGAAAGEDVVPGDPGPVPVPAVDPEGLDLVGVLGPAAGSSDPQGLAAAEVDGEVGEPGRADQERRLARDGVEADDGPEEPRLHGAGVRVAGQPARGRRVVLPGHGPADLHRQVLPARVVEQVRAPEAGLVARVEVAPVEQRPQAAGEVLPPAAVFDQGRHVVVRIERVLERQALVLGKREKGRGSGQ